MLLATGSEVTAQSGTAVYVAVPLATKLAIITQPAGAVDLIAFTTQPVVEVQSAAGAPVLQAGVTVTASIVAGAGSLVGTVTAVTGANGRATFSSLGIDASAPPASFTLRFSASGLTAVDSSSFTVVAASGGFDLLGNKPAGYTVQVYDMQHNDQIPVTGDQLIGSGPGHMVFNAAVTGTGLDQGRARRVSDATCPVNPPFCMEQFIPSGSGDFDNSTGAGLVYTLPPSETRGMYYRFCVWHDATHEFNSVSYKLLNRWNAGNTGALVLLIVQFAGDDTYPPTLNDGGDILAMEDESVGGVPYYPANQPAASKLSLNYFRGAWVNIEIHEIMSASGAGRYRIWVGKPDGSDGGAGALKGELVTDYTGINIAVGVSQLDPCNMTWGGGHGPTHRDISRRYSDFQYYVQP